MRSGSPRTGYASIGADWFSKLLDLAPDIGDAGHELFLVELKDVARPKGKDQTVAVNSAHLTAVRAMTSAAEAVMREELAGRGLPLVSPHDEDEFLRWRDGVRKKAAERAAERLVEATGFSSADCSLSSAVEALFNTVSGADKVKSKNVRTGAFGWASALNTDERPAAIETGDALQALASPMAELARIPLSKSWAVLAVGPAADIVGRVESWEPPDGGASIPAVALIIQWMHLTHLDVPFDGPGLQRRSGYWAGSRAPRWYAQPCMCLPVPLRGSPHTKGNLAVRTTRD